MFTNSPIYKLYDVDESISLMVFELLAVSLPEVINIPLIFYSKYKVEEC